jgi:hypothetical protein
MVPKPQKMHKLQQDDNRNAERLLQKVAEGKAEFVSTELQTAIVFCEVALSADNPERRARNIENALKGYQTALHFSQALEHDLKNDCGFQEKLADLKDLLRELGCDVQ